MLRRKARANFIKVISGDTRTCKMHIAGCRSLIEASKQNLKRKYSAKARALHRTFLFLWIIQESTALSYESVQVAEDENSVEQASPESTAKWLDTMQEGSPELEESRCELVYAVPQEILILLGRTTSLVQEYRFALAKSPNSSLPSSLLEKSRKLENEILEWPVEKILLHDSIASLDADTQKIIGHQTRLFHGSVIIFFSQHIRSIHRQFLQPYVHSVIDHLEAIENVKQRIGIKSGPTLWPAFVAASEAVGTDLQDRFAWWFDNVETTYGLGNVSAAKAVIKEVWERRKGAEEGVSSDWRVVAESQRAHLMLS
jgi:arginine metabolism regulation protein II